MILELCPDGLYRAVFTPDELDRMKSVMESYLHGRYIAQAQFAEDVRDGIRLAQSGNRFDYPVGVE